MSVSSPQIERLNTYLNANLIHGCTDIVQLHPPLSYNACVICIPLSLQMSHQICLLFFRQHAIATVILSLGDNGDDLILRWVIIPFSTRLE